MSDNPYADAIELWGEQAQIDMMIEEMAELTHALCKLKRAKYADVPRQRVLELAGHVLEELADVQIMINQMTVLFGTEPFNVVYRQKVKRMEDMIRRAKDEED